MKIRVRGVTSEDFVNYKECSMFIALGTCDWKCCVEANIPTSVCQNSELVHTSEMLVSVEILYNLYINNPLTSAIVIGGLEPFTRKEEVFDLIRYFRDRGCNDTFIIYTGYNSDEVVIPYDLHNLIIKYGRYVPNEEPHFDEVLGVKLASDNQYAVKIS